MREFRVRRERKYREWDGSLAGAFIIARLEKLDASTFFYIRNGQKLFRMSCDLEFGEHLFPSKHQIDLTEPLMAPKHISQFSDIMTKRDWEEEVRKRKKKERDYDAWEKANPDKSWIDNPFRDHSFDNLERYESFDKSSVYFDDMTQEVEKQIKYYNRIAVILQGLFDRSEILHPHPPAKLWTHQGMADLVELVYDGAGAIHYQDPPDFEVYRVGLRAPR